MNIILHEIQKLKAYREDIKNRIIDIPIDEKIQPPPEPPNFQGFKLRYANLPISPPVPAMPIDQLRADMKSEMIEYILSRRKDIFMFKIPAGAGKSHAAIDVAQWAASQGLRVLWAASRHKMFSEISKHSNFKREYWTHFFPIHKNIGDDDPIPTTCIYNKAMHSWMARGYPSIDLCKNLCLHNGYIEDCVYRNQKNLLEPIIFTMHQHLALGLSIDNFDLVICDELPLNSFTIEKLIPVKGIDSGGKYAIGKLMRELVDLCNQQPHPNHNQDKENQKTSPKAKWLEGKELFDKIGPILQQVDAQLSMMPKALPDSPKIHDPKEVEKLPYFYIFDFLKLAFQEYDCWLAGKKRWANRVAISYRGLHMFTRHNPWKSLPRKMIVLDATSPEEIYIDIFKRPVITYERRIERQGKIIQIVGKLYGSSTTRKKVANLDSEDGYNIEHTKHAKELLHICLWIKSKHSGKRIGVVCNKSIRGLIEQYFASDDIFHYYNTRGSNALIDVDILILAGAPSPSTNDVINTALALNPDRIESYYREDKDGKLLLPFVQKDRYYNVTPKLRKKIIAAQEAKGDQGNTPYRLVSGFWNDPDLQRIFELSREQEIVQALHRCRINIRPAIVYNVNSIPINEELDEIMDAPMIEHPEGITWQNWLTIEDWLSSQKIVTANSLAVQTGLKSSYIKDRKWLKLIADFQPKKWILEPDPDQSMARGPQQTRLRRVR